MSSSRILKIRAHGMFGATHSWSYTVRSILFEFYKMGHELYITSTDGYNFAQKEMSKSFDRDIDNADIDICYTLPRNFQQWFNKTSKVKIAIFNWESTALPPDWLKYLDHVDYVIPSSAAVHDVFIKSGWPAEKIITVPLGVDWEHFGSSSPMDIPGLNSFKFLNISIPHYRKNIDIVLDSYYSAFTTNDDVSLLIKSSFDKPKNKFECDLSEIIKVVQGRHKDKRLPKVHILIEKFKDMAPLYKAANCLVSASSFEGFGLPMLEAFAADLQVIAPRASGQLDFLNDDNSFMVGVDKISAGEKYQYWKPDNSASTFLPKKSDIIESMREVYSGKTKSFDKKLIDEFSWKNSANKIINIYDNFHK